MIFRVIHTIKYYFHQYFLLNVTGCPLPGYYGDNCSLECKDGHCDRVEGTFLGCKAGFIGPRCDMGIYVCFFP